MDTEGQFGSWRKVMEKKETLTEDLPENLNKLDSFVEKILTPKLKDCPTNVLAKVQNELGPIREKLTISADKDGLELVGALEDLFQAVTDEKFQLITSRIISSQSRQREDCFQKTVIKRGLRRMRRRDLRERSSSSQ